MPSVTTLFSSLPTPRLTCRHVVLVSATPAVPRERAEQQGLEAFGTDDLARIAATEDRRDAWRLLYERSYRFLLDYAGQLEGDPDRAGDLVQDALLKAWANRGKYDPRYPWVTWIRTILRHQSFSRQRTEKAYHSVLDRARPQSGGGLWHGRAPESTGRSFERRELRRLLDEVVAELTETEREVLLAWADGARIVDLAEEWGENPSTLRGRLWRARNRLSDLAAGDAPSAFSRLADQSV